MKIRHATDEGLADILAVERDAFGEESEAALVQQLLDDPTARPLISLVAEDGGRVVGHVLLTRAVVEGAKSGMAGDGETCGDDNAGDDGSAANREPAAGSDRERGVHAMILAPLAVAPQAQRHGIGTALVEASLDEARRLGVGLIFLLGHPEYYPRFGFRPAGELGFKAPHPIPDEHADAWMVVETREGLIDATSGTIIPAETLRRPEHWRE